jgi:hypothetical protein
MVFADQAADDLSALDPGSDIDDVAGAKTICVVIGDNLPEKRKAGGSTPPLTTHSDQQKRRLTCENRWRRRSSFFRLVAAESGSWRLAVPDTYPSFSPGCLVVPARFRLSRSMTYPARVGIVAVERVVDAALVELVLAVDALGVDAK